MTIAPSSGAGIFASEPPHLPMAVRTALTITACCIIHSIRYLQSLSA
jgi:hypothetical protein